jgi:hypothetical protein
LKDKPWACALNGNTAHTPAKDKLIREAEKERIKTPVVKKQTTDYSNKYARRFKPKKQGSEHPNGALASMGCANLVPLSAKWGC